MPSDQITLTKKIGMPSDQITLTKKFECQVIISRWQKNWNATWLDHVDKKWNAKWSDHVDKKWNAKWSDHVDKKLECQVIRSRWQKIGMPSDQITLTKNCLILVLQDLQKFCGLKGKVVLSTPISRVGCSGGVASLILIFTLRLLLSLEKIPFTHLIGGWVGSKAVPDDLEERRFSCSYRDSNSKSPSSWPTGYTDWANATRPVSVFVWHPGIIIHFCIRNLVQGGEVCNWKTAESGTEKVCKFTADLLGRYVGLLYRSAGFCLRRLIKFCNRRVSVSAVERQ
jgi:hypothetical protein